jgi:hypothetical protein
MCKWVWRRLAPVLAGRQTVLRGLAVMEAMQSNPFNVGDTRSRRDKLDNKLRLALGRGLAATYAEVLREPIPERLQLWLRRLEMRERQDNAD